MRRGTFRVIEGVMKRLKASLRGTAMLIALAMGAQWLAPSVAVGAPRVIKGPYLMDVRPDSIAVLFELESAAPAVVVARAGSATELRFPSDAARSHEVVLRGLAPSTRYTYEVLVDGSTGGRGSFVTAPLDGSTDSTRFLVYGDARSGPETHARLARSMREEAADFVLHTGDMVADGRDAEDWQELFDTTRALYAEVPVFPTLGNHDARPSGEGLPAYRHFMRAPEGAGEDAFYAFDYGPVRVLVLDSNQSLERGTPERAWLEREASRAHEASAPAHLFASVHHGPFSSGPHGPNDAIAGTAVEQLLRDAGVELIFEGHDHTYERGDSDGLKYVLTGGAGAPLYGTNHELPYQLAFEPSHHYVRVVVEGSRVAITAIRQDGSVLDACAFTKGGPWRCVGGAGDGRGRVVTKPLDPVEALVRFAPGLALLIVGALIGALVVRRVRASRRAQLQQSAPKGKKDAR
jgi:hypothetical protein